MKRFTIAALLWHAGALAGPGGLISVQSLPSMSAKDVQSGILKFCPRKTLPPIFEVQRYKLTYETRDPQGKATVGTGLFMVPVKRGKPLPLVSYQHGTITSRVESPSGVVGPESLQVGYCFAGLGYAVSMADNLGLGDSKLSQVFYHAESQSRAAADMLTAVHAASAEINISLSAQLFLVGISQGGHTTMALHRHLEASSQFAVTASAPIAGAYDIENRNFLNVMTNPKYMRAHKIVYLVYGMNEIYGYLKSYDEAFLPKYAQQIPEIFSGRYNLGEVIRFFPTSPADVLQLNFMQEIMTNPDHPFRLALRKSEVYNWKPNAPVRIFYGENDVSIDPDNSKFAASHMKTLGADVTLICLGQVDHQGSTSPGFVQAEQWFDSLVKN